MATRFNIVRSSLFFEIDLDYRHLYRQKEEKEAQ